jgi:hypothetical protein
MIRRLRLNLRPWQDEARALHQIAEALQRRANGEALTEIGRSYNVSDLTWLFWTKLCEKLSLERSFGYAEEAVQRGADRGGRAGPGNLHRALSGVSA